jgi:hypothetical protein
MVDIKRDEGSAKKLEYIKPELIPIDPDKGAVGACSNGSTDLTGNCTAGGIPAGSCGVGSSPLA